MVRVSDKFRIPLAILDEWPVDAILDEAEVNMWLHDVDNPPPPPKATGPGGLGQLGM